MAKKRRRGEGCVYQRPDGLWTGILSLGIGADGKRRRRSVYGKTLMEVQEKMRQLGNLKADGHNLEPSRETLNQLLDEWLEVKKSKISAKTLLYLTQHVRKHIRPRLGETKLKQITTGTVERFYADLINAGTSRTMARKVGVTLGSALEFARKHKRISSNPVYDVEPPKPEHFEHAEPLSPAELRQFLAAAEGDRYFSLFVLAVHSGMRQGELLGLCWKHVRFELNQVQVRQSLVELVGQLELRQPKTRGSRRDIDLSAQVMDALADRRKEALAEGTYGPDMPVFCNLAGGFIRKETLLRLHFHPALRRGGVRRVRFHDLRHGAASLMLANGIDVKTVSSRLGHANASTTLNVYAHVLKGSQGRAAELMENLLSETPVAVKGQQFGGEPLRQTGAV
jgi:integrase